MLREGRHKARARAVLAVRGTDRNLHCFGEPLHDREPEPAPAASVILAELAECVEQTRLLPRWQADTVVLDSKRQPIRPALCAKGDRPFNARKFCCVAEQVDEGMVKQLGIYSDQGQIDRHREIDLATLKLAAHVVDGLGNCVDEVHRLGHDLDGAGFIPCHIQEIFEDEFEPLALALERVDEVADGAMPQFRYGAAHGGKRRAQVVADG